MNFTLVFLYPGKRNPGTDQNAGFFDPQGRYLQFVEKKNP